MKSRAEVRKRRVLALIIAIIWLHSCMPPSISHEESGFFLLFIQLFVPGATDFFVRKLAHFVEYTILGVTLGWNEGIEGMKNILLNGALIALVDETIQLFSGRGSAVPDIWLDSAGVLCGFLLYTVWKLISPVMGRNSKDVRLW